MNRRHFVRTTAALSASMLISRQGVSAVSVNPPAPVCFWDFERSGPLISKGRFRYVLREGSMPVERVEDERFKALELREGQYLYIPRADCPALDLHGKRAQLTMTAWLKRGHKRSGECEAIAGVWNETNQKRQYGMFLNLGIFNSRDQIAGHISGTGGPTPGQPWCMEAAIGATPVPRGWFFAAMTYDGLAARSYLNGVLDTRHDRNPYRYSEGLFEAGKDGADFTVGAVHRSGTMGNFYVGKIAQLAVYDRALGEDELAQIYRCQNLV